MNGLTSNQEELMYAACEIGAIISFPMDSFSKLLAEIEAKGRAINSITIGELREIINCYAEALTVNEIELILDMDDDNDL